MLQARHSFASRTLYQTRGAFTFEGHFGSQEADTQEANMHMATQTFANTANTRMATKGLEETCRVTAGSSFCERHMTDKHACTHVEELGVPFTFSLSFW